MILRTLGRLILVPIALLFGAGTAAVVAIFLGLQKITVAMAGKEGGAQTVAAYWDIVIQGGALIAAVTLLPALIVVIVGEVARIRSWLYYMLGGGLSLGLLPLLAQTQISDLSSMPPAALWQVLATAGFAGGLVYWVIAGRTA